MNGTDLMLPKNTNKLLFPVSESGVLTVVDIGKSIHYLLRKIIRIRIYFRDPRRAKQLPIELLHHLYIYMSHFS